MKKATFAIIGSIVSMAISTTAFGHASFIGYSGAPGASGRCASSCHGSSGGTITVTGFPPQYVPGQVYAIAVTHNGGSTIRQFNGSCRVGTGSQNAGTLAAGLNTATYNTSGETNGIHLSGSSVDAASFQWTAPAVGTGTVKLYLAGHQGTSASGANTEITLTATELVSAIDDEPLAVPSAFASLNNYPNPFNPQTTIHFEIPQTGHVTIEVYDIQGRKLSTLYDGISSAGKHDLIWNAANQPSGIYFCRMTIENESVSKMITLLK
jgi:hypothetical protein